MNPSLPNPVRPIPRSLVASAVLWAAWTSAGQLAGAEAPAPSFLPPCPGVVVRLAGTVVATVARGRRFGVRQAKAGAYEIQVFSGRTLRHGWIEARHVRELRNADVDLAGEALAIAQELNPAADVAALRARVDALRARVTKAAEGAATPTARFRVISRVLFREERFRYQKAAHPLDRVLEHRTGNCLSLSLLYMAVARDLRMPLCGVSVPKHAFVRYDDGAGRFNIEPSMGGILVSDAYLRDRYGGKDRPPPKLLSHLELVGVALSQMASDLALRGDHPRAHKLFARAAELTPRNSETYHNWGNCLLALTRNAQAADLFARAVQCDPRNLGARTAWAVALSKLGQTRSACEQFARVVEAHPTHADAWFNWGTTLLRMGRVAEARAKFARAIALKPQLRSLADDMLRHVGSGEFDSRTWQPQRRP